MKLLIVGCGSIGTRHLRLLAERGDIQLLAFDPNAERRAFAASLGAEVFADYAAALSVEPDGALICSPTHWHITQARQAAEAGCHLFVEKPLSHTQCGVPDLIARCEAHSRILMVAYPLRFHTGIRQIKDWVAGGAIGKPLCGTIHCGQYMPETYPWKENYAQGYVARREWGGGVTLDASHELDYASWLLGEAREVSAVCATLHLQMETEDIAMLTVRYESGALVQFQLNYLDPTPCRRCELTGTEGMVRWDEADETARIWTRRTRAWECVPVPCPDDVMYRAELDHFIRCIETGARPNCDGAAGFESVEISLAALQSSAEQRLIRLT